MNWTPHLIESETKLHTSLTGNDNDQSATVGNNPKLLALYTAIPMVTSWKKI